MINNIINENYNLLSFYKQVDESRRLDNSFALEDDEPLTAEEKKEIDEFWGKYKFAYPNIDYKSFQTFKNRFGKFDVRHCPGAIRTHYLNKWFNSNAYMVSGQNKAMLPMMYPNIKQPRTLIRRMCGLYYDENYNNIIKKSCEKGININYVNTGSKFNLKNDFSVTCIHPDNGYIYSDANDYSAVYILKKDDFKMLLTGDIEKKAEDNILKNKDVREELKNMTVLKAAHHGSASSSGEEFIKLVNPEVTVISCGINNRYGHPKESTLEMLKKYNSDIYVTKECGQVMIRYTKDKFYVKTL